MLNFIAVERKAGEEKKWNNGWCTEIYHASDADTTTGQKRAKWPNLCYGL